jgi:predicted PurR-regulated permease PerM
MPSEDDRATRTVRFEVTFRSLLLTAAVLAGGWVLIQLIPILLVVVAALIFAGTLDPSVQWLERHRVGRTLALTLVFGSAAIGVVVLGLLILPPLAKQVVQFVADAPAMQEDLARWLGRSQLLSSAAEEVKNFDPKRLLAGEAVSKLASFSGGALEFIGYLGSSLVLALYLVADRERVRGSLYAIVPRRHHVRLARILSNLESIVGGYMRGQLITSAAIFVFAFGLLLILRVPGALALAAFAGLTDVIPFVGGLLATTPAVLSALSQGIWPAVIVLLLMVAYQEFESRLLVPRIYGRTLRLPSAVVIIALLAGGRLLGILGALLALPVAAGLRMVFEELRLELPGDDTDVRAGREQDARAQREYERKTAGAGPEAAAEVAGQIAEKGKKEP